MMWRQEIASLGYATCPKCSLCFLSFTGIDNHVKDCDGVLSEGNYAECRHCKSKFKHYKTCLMHIQRQHKDSGSEEDRGEPELTGTTTTVIHLDNSYGQFGMGSNGSVGSSSSGTNFLTTQPADNIVSSTQYHGGEPADQNGFISYDSGQDQPGSFGTFDHYTGSTLVDTNQSGGIYSPSQLTAQSRGPVGSGYKELNYTTNMSNAGNAGPPLMAEVRPQVQQFRPVPTFQPAASQGFQAGTSDGLTRPLMHGPGSPSMRTHPVSGMPGVPKPTAYREDPGSLHPPVGQLPIKARKPDGTIIWLGPSPLQKTNVVAPTRLVPLKPDQRSPRVAQIMSSASPQPSQPRTAVVQTMPTSSYLVYSTVSSNFAPRGIAPVINSRPNMQPPIISGQTPNTINSRINSGVKPVSSIRVVRLPKDQSFVNRHPTPLLLNHQSDNSHTSVKTSLSPVNMTDQLVEPSGGDSVGPTSLESSDPPLATNVLKIESPISAREKSLMEKEAKIAELENKVRETEIKAEEIKREQELLEREERLREWEQELERREREANKRMAEALKVMSEGKYLGKKTSSESNNQRGERVSQEDERNPRQAANNWNFENDKVILTREDLEDMSPSIRPKNTVIVGRGVEPLPSTSTSQLPPTPSPTLAETSAMIQATPDRHNSVGPHTAKPVVDLCGVFPSPEDQTQPSPATQSSSFIATSLPYNLLHSHNHQQKQQSVTSSVIRECYPPHTTRAQNVPQSDSDRTNPSKGPLPFPCTDIGGNDGGVGGGGYLCTSTPLKSSVDEQQRGRHDVSGVLGVDIVNTHPAHVSSGNRTQDYSPKDEPVDFSKSRAATPPLNFSQESSPVDTNRISRDKVGHEVHSSDIQNVKFIVSDSVSSKSESFGVVVENSHSNSMQEIILEGDLNLENLLDKSNGQVTLLAHAESDGNIRLIRDTQDKALGEKPKTMANALDESQLVENLETSLHNLRKEYDATPTSPTPVIDKEIVEDSESESNGGAVLDMQNIAYTTEEEPDEGEASNNPQQLEEVEAILDNPPVLQPINSPVISSRRGFSESLDDVRISPTKSLKLTDNEMIESDFENIRVDELVKYLDFECEKVNQKCSENDNDTNLMQAVIQKKRKRSRSKRLSESPCENVNKKIKKELAKESSNGENSKRTRKRERSRKQDYKDVIEINAEIITVSQPTSRGKRQIARDLKTRDRNPPAVPRQDPNLHSPTRRSSRISSKVSVPENNKENVSENNSVFAKKSPVIPKRDMSDKRKSAAEVYEYCDSESETNIDTGTRVEDEDDFDWDENQDQPEPSSGRSVKMKKRKPKTVEKTMIRKKKVDAGIQSRVKKKSVGPSKAKEERSAETVEASMTESKATPGGRAKRAAAKRAEKLFINYGKKEDQGCPSDISGGSDNSEDSDDNFDLSKEMSSHRLYKSVKKPSGERHWECYVCTDVFPNKDAIDCHLIQEHSPELQYYQDVESDDDYDDDTESTEEKPRSNKRSGAGSGLQLQPSSDCIGREAAYRNKVYAQSLDLIVTDRRAWKSLSKENEYLPTDRQSVKYSLTDWADRGETPQDSKNLQLFQSETHAGAPLFYCGGPVWAMAWCPTPANTLCQFLAVSCHNSRDPIRYKDQSCEPGLIQVWKMYVDPNLETVTESVFSVGIGHDYGQVWGMEWCPSGMWDEKTGQLGGLAIACSDGTVRLFVVQPVTEEEQAKGIKCHQRVADKTLIPGEDNQGHCLSLSWYRGRQHRYIVASFASGLASLWDIGSQSVLLNNDSGLLPVQSWLSHSSSVTSVSFCPSEAEMPGFVVTGGSDRYYRFWDLRDTSVPLQEVKRGMVTEVSWLPGLAAAAVSYDDVYLQAHTQTLITETGFYSNRSLPVIAQNSGVWDQDISPWLGGLSAATSAGEVVVFVLPSTNRSLEHHKSSTKRRTYIYRIEKTDSDSIVSDKLHNLHQQGCTLNFVDLFSNKEASAPLQQEEMMKVRLAEKMQSEDLLSYPISSVNRVRWNPNLGAHLLLASGGESGIVRVQSLAGLNTQEVQSAVAKLG